MEKHKLRGFLKEHIVRRGSFRMHEIKMEGNFQLFSVETQSGTIWAACSEDVETSKKAIINYLMTYRKSMFNVFIYKQLQQRLVSTSV